MTLRLIYIIILAGFVYYRLRIDYVSGLRICVFLLICLPNSLIYELPGNLPNIPVHRAILFSLILVWLKRTSLNSLRQAPLFRMILVAMATVSVSTVASSVFSVSFKTFLSLTVEVMAFYFILATSHLQEKDYFSFLNSAVYAIGTVAFFTFTERYFGFNPVDAFNPEYVRPWKYQRDILSTYPHRIHLGAAMAMGWPLAAAGASYNHSTGFKQRKKFLIILLLMIGSLYFSTSRGPWLAAVIGGMVLVSFGSFRTRKKIILLASLSLLILVIRPGVLDTLTDLGKSTFQKNTQKASSYHYRWELWQKAYREIGKSPRTLLIGYGPGTHQVLDWTEVASYDKKVHSFWSWDNHFATNLLEFGFIGFFATSIIYLVILWALFKSSLQSSGDRKDIFAALLASASVYVFMMTNVYIFSPQLNYLFWLIVAVGMKTKA